MWKKPLSWWMVLLNIGLLGLILIALCLGRYGLSPFDVLHILLSNFFPVDVTWTQAMYNVVMEIRLPRILAAVFVGAALALSGAVYQAVFRNALVSPDILGVSHGASVGACLGILLHVSLPMMQFMAFGGGLVAVGLALAIPLFMRRNSDILLVLSGIIVAGFMSSLIGLMKYLADPDTELADITYWQLGSLAKVSWDTLWMILPLMFLTGGILLALRWRINVLSLGSKEAKSLGVDLFRERVLVILCATLLTASAVCLSGTIGWIGLVMPHLSRLLTGNDHVKLLPVTVVVSAGFLIIVDTLARSATQAEIPLGILTGFIGAPFFAWILMKQHRGD